MNFIIDKLANKCYHTIRFLGLLMLVGFISGSVANSIPALNLLSTKNFVILAGSTVTGIPPVAIKGNVGLSPAAGSFIVGFDGSNVDGILYVVDATGPAGSVQNATLLQTAKSDLTTAYNDAAGRTPVPTGSFLNPGGGNIGGLNLVPGLYKFTSAAAITGSDVTLTGNANDVWIFQIASSLNLGSGIKVILAGGAQAANIFWQVGTSATLGTYSTFKGTILADQSISFGTGASLDGRALAFSAAVTMGSGVTTNRSDLKFPIFTVNPNNLNFGNVPLMSSKLDSVIVKNTGTADLIIDSLKSSNNSFTFSPNSGTLAPNATKKYYVTFAPTTSGVKNGFIYFYNNGENLKDSISVTGNGSAGPIFSVNPNNLNFGNVGIGNNKLDSVVVTNTGNANLVISTLSSSNSMFTVSPGGATITPGGTKKYYVTFAPTSNGVKNGFIYFNHNGSNLKDSIPVTGNGSSAPIFAANPDNLNFGNVPINVNKVDSLIVSNIGNANLIISSLSSSNSMFTFSPSGTTIAPGGTQKYYVTFKPTSTGVKNGFIYFNHNGSNLKDSISVTGNGSASPIFAVNPNNLNFGNVLINTYKSDSVTVTNTGNADLIISSISTTNNYFYTTPTSATITPGGTMKFYVKFSPVSDGVKNGVIYFNHNGANGKDSITVVGIGVSPKFTVNPASLNFGNVKNGTSKLDSLTVTNTGTYNLIVNNIASSNSLFTVMPSSAVITPGSSKVVYVTFSPISDGVKTGFIYFYHNASAVRTQVAVTGIGVSAKFTANPTSLNFGNVIVGQSKMDSITVTNTGLAILNISNITISNNRFTTNVTSATILSGNSKKFYFTFSPIADGNQNANIVFYSDATTTTNTIPATGNGISPKFTANKAMLDFGNVRVGTTKYDTLTVTNTGLSVLNISNIVMSNNLFGTSVTTGTIQPGASKDFYFSFSPIADGVKSGNITFTHNAINPTNVIDVTGNGISPKFVSNPANLDFGNVRVGLSKKDSITVTNNSLATLNISSITISNNLYTTNVTSATIPANSSMKFYFTFAPTADGVQNGTVTFNHDGLITPSIVGLTGNGISPQFASNPASLDFGNVRVGTTKKDSIVVSNSGLAVLNITNITSNNNLFKINTNSATIQPGASKKFYITFSPVADGTQDGNFTFTHDAIITPSTVSVTGNGISPQFASNPASLDFGNVRVGLSKMDSITVSNSGLAVLNITNITSNNNLFTINTTTGTIQPGSSMKFYLTFSPLADGIQNGSFTFTHDAIITPSVVNVTGNGISPKFASNPASLDFGNVRVGTTKMDSITVSNSGLAVLNISNITSNNNLFKVTTTTGTVQPGSSMKFYLTFSPVADGIQNGSFTFTHDALITPSVVNVTGNGISPQFAANPANINFGNVRVGLIKMDSITVSNSGLAVLNITNVTNSNNLFAISSTSGTIQPGSSMKFYFTFSPVADGVQNGTFTFIHDALITPNVVNVTGNGISPMFGSNPSNIDFGNVVVGKNKMDSVTVNNTGLAVMNISNITSSNNRFTVNTTTGTIQPGSSMKFYITFSPLADGIQSGNITFTHDGIISQNIVTVVGNGVSPKFSVNPLNLDFGDVELFTSKRDFVTITNKGTSDLVISDFVSTNSLFTIEHIVETIAPGMSENIYITFSPLTDGVKNGKIIFKHNASNLQDEITVTGRGISSRIAISPLVIHFGRVLVGESKTDSVIVSNIGLSPLTIMDYTTTNGVFTVKPASGYLLPNGMQKFYITFTPIVSDSVTGYVYFNNSSPHQNFPVTLFGTGVAPIFTVSPLNLNFGMVKLGSSKLDSVTVTNTGNADLILSGVTTMNNVFTVTPTDVTIPEGQSRKFYIRFTPLVNGMVYSFVDFKHNAINKNNYFSITGIGGDDGLAPVFSTNVTNLDFGTLIIGFKNQKSIIITNTGLRDLVINDILPSDGQYSVSPKVATIKPGFSETFVITFAPTLVGTASGQIQFTHNAGRDIINVTGIGISIITISEARKLPLGTEFAVDGVVTRTLGQYTRIQDETGALTIVQNEGDFFNDVASSEIAMEDKIRIQGKLSEIDHLMVVSGTDLISFERLSRSNILPVPVQVSLSELAINGEKYESMLVTLQDLTINGEGDLKFRESTTYQTLDASDLSHTVAIRIGSQTNTYMIGRDLIPTSAKFVGVLGQISTGSAFTGYQLTPVLPSDLVQFLTDVNTNETNNLFTLNNNYPNPFKSVTTIEYNLTNSGVVSLKVLNSLGIEIATLVDGFMESGTHTVMFDADEHNLNLSSGVYYLRLDVGNLTAAKSMILIK
jgi:hypothetical protein